MLSRLLRVVKRSHKKSINLVVATLLAFSSMAVLSPLLFSQSALADTLAYSNGFETDTSGWTNYEGGTIVQKASGDDGINAASGSNFAEITGPDYTNWGGYQSIFPSGGYTTSLDVYLDTSLADGSLHGFDFSSAVNNQSGTHLRDFVFHLGTIPGQSGSWAASVSTGSSANYDPSTDASHATINSTGWYTLKSYFHDNGSGQLGVVMQVVQKSTGNIVGSWVLSTPSDLLSSVVGGNRYGWFTDENFNVTYVAIDNASISTGYPNSVVVDNNWAGASYGDQETLSGNTYIYGIDAFSSVQAAVDNVASGGTVTVEAGTYAENVTVTKPLTLSGARAGVAAADTSNGVARSGSESQISRVYITSSDVTVDGFSLTSSSTSGQVQVLSASTLSGIKIENNIFSGYDNVAIPTNAAGNITIQNNLFENPSASAEAIQIKTSSNPGDCTGTQILNNVFTAATTNGAADINLSCTGSNSTNVTISGNRSENASDPNGPNMVAFSGVSGGIVVSNNTASTSGSQVLFFGSVSGTAKITGNTFTDGGGNAVSIHGGDNYIGVNDSSNTGTFTIQNNTLTNNAYGIHVASGAISGSGSVNASLNYWGTSQLSDIQAENDSGVTITPYFTNSTMTLTSDNQVAPDTSGNATVNNTTPQVVVTSTSNPVTVTVSSGTSNAKIDFSNLKTDSTHATLPQTTVNTSTVNVSIPSNTVVTASGSSWNGIIEPPHTASYSVPSGNTSLAISVGADDGSNLTFDQPVKLVLTGQAGKLVGFEKNGSFTQISTECSTATPTITELNSLGSVGACYVNSGNDLIVWTNHFTTFATYTANAGSGGGSSSSSNGSSNSNSSQSSEAAATSTEEPAAASIAKPVIASMAQPKTAAKEAGGIRWYWWVITIAIVMAVAAALAYRYADGTDRN